MGALAVIGLVASGCGGGSGGGNNGAGETGAVFDEPPTDEGAPERGGRLVYALEAETQDGWCLPTAELAAGGIQVAGAIYDTLTVPADDGGGGVKYVPYLAESVEHDDSYTEWTIKIREGVTFHDGSPLTAEVVQQNLDAYRNGLLFRFVLADDVESVDVVDSLTVKVTTRVPWIPFDAALWSTGRLGIVAPAQLADPPTCGQNLIGTGPFRIVNCEETDCGWTINDKFVAERNPDYWRRDENGEPLPYLAAIEFRPVVDESQRVNGLKGDDFDVIQTADGNQIGDLRREDETGQINLLESDFAAETSYTMLNASQPPFDSLDARKAVAHAIDRQELVDINQGGVVQLSAQPFTEDNIAYVDPEDLPFPEHDVDEARRLVQKYEDDTGEDLSFTLLSTNDQSTLELAQLEQSQFEAAGMSVTIDQVDQTQLIETALGGEFDAVLWRNHPGGDPDTQEYWWRSTNDAGERNPVNFGRIDDPEIDRLLDDGRSEPDPVKRQEIYQDLSRRFADQVYNVWGWYTVWAFPSAPEVKGVYPPTLPTGDEPVIIASVQPVVGLWVEH